MWPDGSRFALFLSHDIDEIHDRELWRFLAEFNHMRKLLFGGDIFQLRFPIRRITRGILRPKPAIREFERILDAEGKYGFRSTFFVLKDRYWARHGARYRIADPELRDILKLVVSADCEAAVHGGYYDLDDSEGYRNSREAIEDAIGTQVRGIRNHYLRFSGEDTWAAQLDAGFSYDATFGHRFGIGPKEGRWAPFWALKPSDGRGQGLVELPLTLMDAALFRNDWPTREAALGAAWEAILPVIEKCGLVSLLWHNVYFEEPEFADYQWVYERLLKRLASMNPWCATGDEICNWWRSQ